MYFKRKRTNKKKGKRGTKKYRGGTEASNLGKHKSLNVYQIVRPVYDGPDFRIFLNKIPLSEIFYFTFLNLTESQKVILEDVILGRFRSEDERPSTDEIYFILQNPNLSENLKQEFIDYIDSRPVKKPGTFAIKRESAYKQFLTNHGHMLDPTTFESLDQRMAPLVRARMRAQRRQEEEEDKENDRIMELFRVKRGIV